VVQVHP
jgi:hypothetical protein